VIASRQDKLTRLSESIRGKSRASDIQQSLEKEKKRYESLMARMNCNQNRTEDAEDKVIDRLTNSAMKEYCSYTYYLDYLDANIENDFSRAEQVDGSIGIGMQNKQAKNTEAAAAQFRGYSNTLLSERNRANETVPKAVLAYQEMDRTYIAHILLVIIFDDYLKLRDNLNTYLALISQTFEKAYNAQDDRQR
jgi:tRNA threonylcarbamoyladenosine modification (KEOPS) complex  Pcc1 subunit